MLTRDEQLDRLERSLERCLRTSIREQRESRSRAIKLRAYEKALKERDDARYALEARPSDPEAQEALRKAQEALDRASSELRH